MKESDISDQDRDLARVLWDFHCIEMDLVESDVILALGSHDERVAEAAASLMLAGLAPLLVTSGGYGKVTKAIWNVTEGQHFADLAVAAGVPPSKVLVEDRAGNTGDNVAFTRDLLAERGVHVDQGILVAKPYMKLRAIATAEKQWPAVRWLAHSPNLSFDEYASDEVPELRMINLLVGDLQRIKVYAEDGFQSAKDVPDAVWTAYEQLVDRGFDDFVLREADGAPRGSSSLPD